MSFLPDALDSVKSWIPSTSMSLMNLHPDALDQDVRTRTSPLELKDLPGYVDLIKHSNSIDDRKFLLENMVTLMSRLSTVDSPALQELCKTLQVTLIDLLYKDLPHPPSTYLSILSQDGSTAVSNPIKYAYRNADGSNYVPLFPGLGKANSPYARSVPQTNFTPPATLPDAGLVFDTLLSRDEFVDHPGGISSLFFAFADLVIHSVFNTSPRDSTINLTSSYLDLAILYGNSQAEQDSVRNKDGRGRLYDDVFADSRLLFMPPSATALLVLLSRNHNYSAQKLLEINEHGRYKPVSQLQNEAEKVAQDNEIFEKARLINSLYFMQIILGDYVGAILGLVRDGYSWRLDPLSQSREPTHDLTPRGEGNVVSIEFNLLYRWHATLSKKDTEWTEDLFKELFEVEGKDFGSLTAQDFFKVLQKMKADPDPRKWTFNKLQRGANGRFKDSDLAEILYNATSWRAGAYKARGIPEVLRVIEVLGIEQARRWGACSMNDFRRFLGLKPYADFKEWNHDERVHTAAAALYKDIENLELYVGLQAEEPKKPMAGAGLCPGYTISRAILADAVCLTRGDRFLTVEFTPFSLSAWGYRDCQFDVQDGSYGGLLTKLLFRTLPSCYPPRSAYAHFPFLDPVYMKERMSKRDPTLADKYIWTRPTPSAHAEDVVVVKTAAGVRAVFDNPTVFPTEYAERLEAVIGRKGVNHAFVTQILSKDISKWATYFAAETQRLIEHRSLKHIGKSGKVQYVDIVRDVINVLPVHWICKQIAGLPLKDDDLKDEQRQYEEFSDVCRYIFLTSDREPVNDWHLRESSVKTFQKFEKVVKEHLSSKVWDSNSASLAASLPFLKELHAQHHDLTDLAAALFTEVVPTAAHWSQAVAHVVNYYLDDSRMQTRQEIVELAGLRTPQADSQIVAHVRAALAHDPVVWGVYRTAHTTDFVVDSVKVPVGARVFVSIKEANVDATPQSAILSIGEHGLLSAQFFEPTIVQVIGKILGLKTLKRAPKSSGIFNKFIDTTHGAPQQSYVNARADLAPWPESLVVEYNHT
ncbi:heme peroxidase [Mycena sanguinolenta]|nr:heme peroxidase [Mycena sanguinolenta]